MSNEFDFNERLEFSRGETDSVYPDAIKSLLPGCEKVEEPSVEMNKLGVDFVATLRRGAQLFIDVKRRDKGCSKHWKRSPRTGSVDPEVSLEIWSVKPTADRAGIAGWTLDESKITDYTFHVFDPSDSRESFLLPFQLLRVSFIKNFQSWVRQYSHGVQSSGGWESECLFVPASTVLGAIQLQMRLSDLGLPEIARTPSIELGLIDDKHRADLLAMGCVEPGTEDPIED